MAVCFFIAENSSDSALLKSVQESVLSLLIVTTKMTRSGRIYSLCPYFRNEWGLTPAIYRILVNYSNVLGLSQKYEECIGVCIKGIRMLCSEVTQNVIYNFVFNIGWCLCYKNMNSENRGKYKKGIRYIDAAINLCRYFDESKSSLDTMIETKKTLADKL